MEKRIDGSERESHPRFSNKGLLASVERYYVYRYALPCDYSICDSPIPKKIGWWMLYATVRSPIFFKATCLFHLNSFLTSTGISSNQIINSFIPGIVTRMTNGFECIDAQGEKAKMFLDMCRFQGVHQGWIQVLSVMNDMERSPCTHCLFWHQTCEEGPRYAYTTNINYGNQ